MDNLADGNIEMEESSFIEIESSDGALLSNEHIESEETSEEEPVEPSLIEQVSAFLFVSNKPLSIEKLIELSGKTEEELLDALESVSEALDSAGLGFELIEVGGSFQLRSRAKMNKTLHRMITPKMKRLSKAAAESLAVIAYKQPVSKAEIEAIRGVDPLPTIRTLLDGKLIRIVGREDSPGSPALYGTTDFFLERFGLSDLSQLPTVRELGLMADEDGSESQSSQEENYDEENLEDGAEAEVEDEYNETKAESENFSAAEDTLQ